MFGDTWWTLSKYNSSLEGSDLVHDQIVKTLRSSAWSEIPVVPIGNEFKEATKRKETYRSACINSERAGTRMQEMSVGSKSWDMSVGEVEGVTMASVSNHVPANVWFVIRSLRLVLIAAIAPISVARDMALEKGVASGDRLGKDALPRLELRLGATHAGLSGMVLVGSKSISSVMGVASVMVVAFGSRARKESSDAP